ncbi:MAG: STAS domain-containing protein [Isosphaeraceae bacterium]|nr:STAS domain-containing protein [Isosphaeraceae bacterium]
MLTCQTYEMNGVLIIAFEDNGVALDDRQSSLRETLYRSIESHTDGRFALDFSAINYMASSDIGFLITLRRRIDGRKGKLVLFEVDPYIVDALRTMKLLSFFTIAETRADALVYLAAD